MSERGQSRVNYSTIVWGAFVLFIGVVLLLNVTDVLAWRVWGTLWKFWPVLLVLIGLSFVVPRRYPWLMALVSLVVLGGVLGIAQAQNKPGLGPPVFVQQRDAYSAAGIKSANVTIEFAAGSLLIAESKEGPGTLVELIDGRYRTAAERRRSMIVDYRETAGIAKLHLTPDNRQYWDEWRVVWQTLFNTQIPLSIDIRADWSNLNLVLEQLNVDKVNLVMNACSGSLILPATAGMTTIDIDMDLSNLEITVPEGVAVKINADVNVGVSGVNRERFPRQGDYYISPDYETAVNRVFLNILCDVGRVTVK